jgi:two-component system sensor histidine kinase HydH
LVTLLDIEALDDATRRALDIGLPENPTETFLLRLLILLLLAACCYGVQVVFERERRAIEENRESASRQEQLRAAGRLAAEIAHKIKNPLGIINNAAFSIQRALEQNQKPTAQQARIIREEVERADRIITELMGYAQLAEGQVERIHVLPELNHALMTVFPPGAYHSIQLYTDFAPDLPPLLMQRNHFSEIVVNILQNAREILAGLGEIHIRAWARDDTVFVSVRDDGPGISADKLERIFEPYFSTKDKGTGLGLAIARHNAEMYQGTVRAVSQPGEGAEFVLELPTRTFMKKRQ